MRDRPDDEFKVQLLTLCKGVAGKLQQECYEKWSGIFADSGVFESSIPGPVPIQVVIGIAQAFCDASGLRVTLESPITESDHDNPEQETVVGFRKVAILHPTLFIRPSWRQ